MKERTLPLSPARAILFDLDGTLVDSRRDIANACNFALESRGRRALDEGTIAGYVGDGARQLLARAFGLPPGDAEIEQALAGFQSFYAEHAADHTRWMPGALEALDALADRPLALVTNKPRAATLAVLDALGARRRFASIVAGEDAPLKPDPGSILAALRALPASVGAITPRDAWMVGDGPQDILAGRAAGCTTIAVSGGFASRESLAAAEPDATLESLTQLVALVASARAGDRSRP
jgi:phosphoglycolate phosphatase